MAEPTSPIVYDLTKQPLPAKVDTTQTKDSEGFYYRAGDLVEIAADETIRKATAGGRAVGVLLTSIHENQAPDGLDSRHRVAVLTKFKAVVRMIAEGAIAAGQHVVASTTTPGRVKAASNLKVSVDAGSTTVTSTAANGDITTVSGSVLPEEIIGICWKGGADGEEVLILMG